MFDARTVSISIRRAPAEVYAFVRDGSNLPQWAHGLGTKLTRDGEAWIADGPLGRVSIRFAPANELGVVDHDVTLPNGVSVHNPMRVMPNGDGSLVSFTLFAANADFEADAKMVEADLERLERALERT